MLMDLLKVRQTVVPPQEWEEARGRLPVTENAVTRASDNFLSEFSAQALAGGRSSLSPSRDRRET